MVNVLAIILFNELRLVQLVNKKSKFRRDKELKNSQKESWRPNGGYYRNSLFGIKPILRFGAAPFLFYICGIKLFGKAETSVKGINNLLK